MKPEIYASAKILFKEAEELGLNPQWETPYGLFSIQTQKGKQFIFYTKLFSNSQLGSWISQDKYATRLVLEEHKLPVISYCYSTQKAKINEFLNIHKAIIQKPVYGQKAEGVTLITNHQQLKTVFVRDFLYEKYIEGGEYRVWILHGESIAMQFKKNTPDTKHPWKKHIKNLSKSEWQKLLIEMSQKVAKVLHMDFLAVDFIQDKKGKYWLLETNSMPGLYSLYFPDDGEPVKIGKKLLETVKIAL